MQSLLAVSFSQRWWCAVSCDAGLATCAAAIESAKPCLVATSCCWQQAAFVRVWQPLAVLSMALKGAHKVAVAAGSSLLRSICVATLA